MVLSQLYCVALRWLSVLIPRIDDWFRVVSDISAARRTTLTVGELDKVEDHERRHEVPVNLTPHADLVLARDGAVEAGDVAGGLVGIR